ncbi:MAG TPA: PhzF family phenazine biosynthesis protein [Pseudolabrys sp.]|nr:PhzF family phenazine biosynthesis protein [Pseudolabrys sp.]
MRLDFRTVDVFTDRRFGGNPLAVVLDASGLTAAQMQSIAAEFNLSETTFVLPAKEPGHTAAVRIFTPRAELPFAGHPNIGTAFVLATSGRTSGESLVFEEKAGLVALEVIRESRLVVGAHLAAPQPLMRGEEIPLQVVANACSIGIDDIETVHHRPCVASCGTAFVFAEVKTRASLSAARPRLEIFLEHLPMDRATGILLYAPGDGVNIDVYARMFAPLYGVPEDPATGSANVALVGLLASLHPESQLSLQLRIAQGVEMGRPSLLEARAEKRGDRLVGAWIGGRCVPMMQGQFDL